MSFKVNHYASRYINGKNIVDGEFIFIHIFMLAILGGLSYWLYGTRNIGVIAVVTIPFIAISLSLLWTVYSVASDFFRD